MEDVILNCERSEPTHPINLFFLKTHICHCLLWSIKINHGPIHTPSTLFSYSLCGNPSLYGGDSWYMRYMLQYKSLVLYTFTYICIHSYMHISNTIPSIVQFCIDNKKFIGPTSYSECLLPSGPIHKHGQKCIFYCMHLCKHSYA